MIMTRTYKLIFSVALMFLSTSIAFGQTYPIKPIRIVTTTAGTGSDFVARFFAQGISDSLGQPVIVDNRPSGPIPGEIVSRAPSDGYTLLVYSGTLWIGSLFQKMPYNPMSDFAAITIADRSPSVIVVNPSVPVKSVKELIALAKDKPGVLNYGGTAMGSSPHLAAELFKSMAGVNIVYVPYNGLGPIITDVLTNQVQIAFPNPFAVMPHANAGRLRVLAVTTPAPYAPLPGLPTVAASGLPGYEFLSVTSVLAPAKTPATIINRLNQEIVRILNRDDVRAKFLSGGSEVVGSSPEQATAFIKSDMAKFGKVIKDAGIKTY